MALNSVKKRTLGERAAKEQMEYKMAMREKHQDRFSMIQTYKTKLDREHTMEAVKKYQEDCMEIASRQKNKSVRDKEISTKNW